MGDEKEEKKEINYIEFGVLLQQFTKEFIENLEILDTESVHEFLKTWLQRVD